MTVRAFFPILLLVIFVLVICLLLLTDSFLKICLNMSGFVAGMTFWYVCTLFMPSVFSSGPTFTESCADTFMLGF